jgi:hypothetical protein
MGLVGFESTMAVNIESGDVVVVEDVVAVIGFVVPGDDAVAIPGFIESSGGLMKGEERIEFK